MTDLSPKKRILALKNLEKCFWLLSQKLWIGSKNNCLWQKLYWRPLSASILVEIDKRTATGERKKQEFLFVFTLPAERPVLKLLLLAFFWFLRPVGATLCTDYRQIRQEGGGRQHLTHCQSFGIVSTEILRRKLKDAHIVRLTRHQQRMSHYYHTMCHLVLGTHSTQIFFIGNKSLSSSCWSL